ETNSGGESNSQTNSEETCTTQPLPYALRKPSTQQTCNSFDGEICTDKTVTCSVETHNLEGTNSGLFKIETRILNQNSEQIFLTTESKEILENSFEIFTTTTSFQDSNANQELTCFFKTINVPTEEICF
ncbi:MAG: hypothetical protein KC506_02070, partial [Nanoarchaeota archaeon]|nr:hypothetical protein [Nanoarchaeota archaeon]